ncbi:Uncharacterised protein [Salmonella enterica]|uniref:Uncharacterized protein n=1 Tax=Salmonella enterica TaxID=28901 RepID=A0A379QF35_SALER|nr:Uncharacterised protein [Salmonella enterica]
MFIFKFVILHVALQSVEFGQRVADRCTGVEVNAFPITFLL